MGAERGAETRITERANVLPICLAAFFNDMGSDMLFAFYPIFFVQVLRIQDMKILGLVDSLALLFGFVIMPFVGRLADVRGRKHLIWGGYACLMVSRLSQGLARAWTHLIPPKILYQVGRGIRNPPREALLTDSVPRSHRGRAFGLLGSMDTFGAVIGPILGVGLFQLFLNTGAQLDEAYRWIFFLAAAPTTVSVLLILSGTKDIRTSQPTSKAQKRKWGLSILLRDKTLLTLTVVGMLFTFWNVSENFMLVSGARTLNIPKEEFWTTVLLYWLINVSFAPTAYLAGRYSDRFGRRMPVIMGMAVLGVMTLGFAFASSFLTVGALFLMHGLYQGLYRPNVQAWVADLSPADQRAEVIGTFKMLVGLSDIPGPFVFGLIWDIFGVRFPFIVGGVFCLLCAVLVTTLIPAKREV
ncbi:MAG: MFS transporter [Candidatus Bathyarchaeota archaeon]|nr:MAG: MFS transporter [Candidatus Bathyarchaeota archaeon]